MQALGLWRYLPNMSQSYGVFLAHYLSNDTYPGATSLEYAFVGGLSISLALLTSPVATICTRLYGTQVTLAIGILFETAGLLVGHLPRCSLCWNVRSRGDGDSLRVLP